MAYNLFGQSKNRRPIRDLCGLSPDLQHSLEKLYGRVIKIPAPSSATVKTYGVVNGAHKYVVTIRWNGAGAVDRVGLHKPGSGHHRDAELAYFQVQPSGIGTVKLVHVDNFPKKGPDAIHIHHINKLHRRWSLAANGIVTGEVTMAGASW